MMASSRVSNHNFSHTGNLSNIRVGSLNCWGLCDKTKRRDLFEFFRTSSLSFIFLQEVKLDPFKIEEYTREWHNQNIFFNLVSGGQRGTIILCNFSNIKVLSEFNDADGRVQVLDVDFFGNRFHLVNTYFRNSNDIYLQESFITNLYPYIASNYPVIWCGDHNIAINAPIDRLPAKTTQDYCSNYIQELTDYFSLIDVCRALHPNGRFYTWRGPKSCSRIDRVLVSSIFSVLFYEQIDMLVTDHDLVIGHLQYTSHFKWGKGKWKNNCSLYDTDGFMEELKDFWCKESFEVCKRSNLLKWWANTKYQFKIFAIKRGRELSQVKRRLSQMERCGLENINNAILQDPENKTLHKKYNDLKKKLANKKLNEIKEKMFKEKADAVLFGPQPTKMFFMKFKKK